MAVDAVLTSLYWLAAGAFAFGLGMVRRHKSLPGQVEHHPVRSKLLELVGKLRGSNETQLERAAGLTRSAGRHHLRLLEEAGMVKKVPLGRENHYFPPDADEKEVLALTRARHGRAWKLLREILVEPGLHQNELTARVGMSRKILRSHLKPLVEAGLIIEQKKGRFREYYPGRAIDADVWGRMRLDESMEIFHLPGWVEKRLWELERDRNR